MNVLFVAPTDLSDLDGSSVATKEIIKAISEQNEINEVVISYTSNEDLPQDICSSSAEHVPVEFACDQSPVLDVLQEQYYTGKTVQRILAEKEIDITISRMKPILFSPTLISQLYNIPHIVLIRGTIEFNSSLFPPILKGIYWFNVEYSNKIIAAYTEVHEQVRAVNSEARAKTIIIPNAADPVQFSPIAKKDARDNLSYNFDSDELVIGFVGHLVSKHRVADLVRAIKFLQNKIKIHLLIVGGGSQKPMLESLVNKLELGEAVTFVGPVSHNEVSTYINACDLLYGVIDKDSPSNPIKCYEYLACGRPIITSHSPELSFVDDYGCGYILDSVTPQKIADSIQEFIYLPENKKEKMGMEGRNYVIEHHTWNSVAKQIVNTSRHYID